MSVLTTKISQDFTPVTAGAACVVNDMKVFEAAQIAVYVDGDEDDVAVQGVDYTVEIAGDLSGCTVTPLAPLAARATSITVARDTPLTSDFDLAPSGKLNEFRLVEQLDRDLMRDQEKQNAVASLQAQIDVINNTGPVQSIEGHEGVVTLADLELNNVDNTADANKPVSGPQAAALATKQAKLWPDLKADYGATMDGVASDVAALQAAFDAGVPFSVPAGRVVIDGEVLVTSKDMVVFGVSGKTEFFYTGSSASTIKARFLADTQDTRGKCRFEGVHFGTSGAGVHTPFDLYWRPNRSVRERQFELVDCEFAVANGAKGSGQYFAALARLENCNDFSLQSFGVKGAREGTQGNGFLLVGGCISGVVDDYHMRYGDIAFRYEAVEISKIYYKAITPGARFELFDTITGATSGATGQMIGHRGDSEYTDAGDSGAVWGCFYVHRNHGSAAFQHGETITDQSGNSAVITGIATSAACGEGLQLVSGEGVGYNQAIKYIPPRYAFQWGITFDVTGHWNTRGDALDVRMARSVRFHAEVLAYLGDTNASLVNIDSVDNFRFSGNAGLAANSPEVIKMADVSNWSVNGAVVTGGFTSLVKFLNGNVYAGVAPGNAALSTKLFDGRHLVPVYRPGFTYEYATKELTGATVASGGSGYAVGDMLVPADAGKCGYNTTDPTFCLQVTSVDGGGAITGVRIIAAGKYTEQPSNPVTAFLTTPGKAGSGATFDLTWSTVSGPQLPGNNLGGSVGLTDTWDMYGEAAGLTVEVGAGSFGGVYHQIDVPGLRAGDILVASCIPDLSPLEWRVIYDADDQARIQYINRTASPITPAAHTFRIKAFKTVQG